MLSSLNLMALPPSLLALPVYACCFSETPPQLAISLRLESV